MFWKKAKNNKNSHVVDNKSLANGDDNFVSKNSGKKVFVGLSGGVDSSVSALLLKKAGYEVVGVFIKVWQPEGGDCTWKEDRRDAMRVAAHLGIKFFTLDLRDQYKKEVVDYMISEYVKGRTPNPDVMCNKEVKFGGFMKWALEQGADFVATGHYAVTKNGELYEGKDKEKDQSYFLWTLSSDKLNKILFPIGHLNKNEVRIIAEKNNIPVAKKKDSQGVCFIGHINMKDFIKEQVSLNPELFNLNIEGLKSGDVLNISGEVIGTHDGSSFYTIGERHGFNLFNNKTDMPRYYVIDKDIPKNTITIAEKKQIEKDGCGTIDKMFFKDILFVSNSYKENLTANSVLNCLARTRYRQTKFKCSLRQVGAEVGVNASADGSLGSHINNGYEVSFENGQSGIAAGQSLVLYFDERTPSYKITSADNVVAQTAGARVLGGAII